MIERYGDRICERTTSLRSPMIDRALQMRHQYTMDKRISLGSQTKFMCRGKTSTPQMSIPDNWNVYAIVLIHLEKYSYRLGHITFWLLARNKIRSDVFCEEE